MDKEILLVDDEPGILKVLSISLADRGYQVMTAETGEEALEIFQEKRPGIILTDIKMPGMDGIELLQKVKDESPDTEVIMITGHGDMELAIQSLKHEASDFITKPIHDEALDIALRKSKRKDFIPEQAEGVHGKSRTACGGKEPASSWRLKGLPLWVRRWQVWPMPSRISRPV